MFLTIRYTKNIHFTKEQSPKKYFNRHNGLLLKVKKRVDVIGLNLYDLLYHIKVYKD